MEKEERRELIGTVVSPGECVILNITDEEVTVLHNVEGKLEVKKIKW